MSQAALFAFGAGVSIVVFAGGFLYVMFSFSRWADRSENASPLTK